MILPILSGKINVARKNSMLDSTNDNSINNNCAIRIKKYLNTGKIQLSTGKTIQQQTKSSNENSDKRTNKN